MGRSGTRHRFKKSRPRVDSRGYRFQQQLRGARFLEAADYVRLEGLDVISDTLTTQSNICIASVPEKK